MSEETTTTQPQVPETGIVPAIKALFNGATEEDFADRMEILSGFSTHNRTVTGLRFPKELRDVVVAFLEAGGVGDCVCIDETADHQFCTARFTTDHNAQASTYRQFLDDMATFDFVGRCLSAGTFPCDAEQVAKFMDALTVNVTAAADARPPDALEFPDVSECLINAARVVLDHFFQGTPPSYFFYEDSGDEDGDWHPPATVEAWERRADNSEEDDAIAAPGTKNDFGAVMCAIYQLFKYTDDDTVDPAVIGRLPSLAAIEILLDELGRRPPRPASFHTGDEWDDRPLFFGFGNACPLSHGLAMRTVQQGEYIPDDFSPLMRSTPTHERCCVSNSPMGNYFSENPYDLSNLYKKQRWPIAALVAGEEALSRISPAALLAAGNPDDFRKYVGDLVIEWLRLGGLDGDFAAVFSNGSHIGFSDNALLRLSPAMLRRWFGDTENSDLLNSWRNGCVSASTSVLRFMSVECLAGFLYGRKSEYPCPDHSRPDLDDWDFDSSRKDSQTQQQATFLKHAVETAAVASFVFAVVRKEMLRDMPALPHQAFRVEKVQRKPDAIPNRQEKDDTIVNVGGLAREWRHLTHGLPASYLSYDSTDDDPSAALRSCCPPDEASRDLLPVFAGVLDRETRRMATSQDCNYAPRMDRFLMSLIMALVPHDGDDVAEYLANSSRSSERNHRGNVIVPAVYSGMTVQNPSESEPSTPVFYVPDDVVAASWKTRASSTAPNITEWSKWLDKHPAAMDACRLRRKENGGTRYAWTVVETNLAYDKCLAGARTRARALFNGSDAIPENDDPLLTLLAAIYANEMTSFVANGDKPNAIMVGGDTFFNARTHMKKITADRLVSVIADPTNRLDETAKAVLKSVFLSSSVIEELEASTKSSADFLAFLKRHVTIATAKDDDGRLFLFIGTDGPLTNVSRILYRCATAPDSFGLSESMAEAYRRRLPDEIPEQSDDPLVVRVFEGSGPMVERKCILNRLLANGNLTRGWLRPLVAPPNPARDTGTAVSVAFPRSRYFSSTPTKAEVTDNMITRLPGFIA